MNYRTLDMAHYTRRAHFDYFRTLPYPYVGTTVSVDVTDALEYAKQNNRSFYLTFLHAAALASDSIPELRQRIHSGQIIEYTECPTSHVELLQDSTYCYCTLYHHMDLNDYYSHAEEARKHCADHGITEDPDSECMYFISALPWLHYNALIQPVAGGEESNPRITWGKYQVDAAGRAIMPVSILAHHALVDGIQLGQFYTNLDFEIQKYKTLI
ncbi:MAG: chloramphenicol acetyltransferase [Eubacterium sp.]|nr:chloramphenicol acetyltransferase [Eubacterium sp.]